MNPLQQKQYSEGSKTELQKSPCDGMHVTLYQFHRSNGDQLNCSQTRDLKKNSAFETEPVIMTARWVHRLLYFIFLNRYNSQLMSLKHDENRSLNML